MDKLSVLSLNCHGFNEGTLKYLQDKCKNYDFLLLQETWLSDKTSVRLQEISPQFSVIHCSAMEDKLQQGYLHGRPFGGTAVLYRRNVARDWDVSLSNSNNPRCTAVKFCFRDRKDLVIASVYMPCLDGSLDKDIEYQSTVGYLQGIIDTNLGCDFIFAGDLNVSKKHGNVAAARSLVNFCAKNSIIWLDTVNDSIDYTYHADANGHFSLIDHMLVSQCLVQSHQSVVIHVDDINISDHYAISCAFDMTVDHAAQAQAHLSNKITKCMWNKVDPVYFESVLKSELAGIQLPVEALLCQHNDCCNHSVSLERYYQDIVRCITVTSKKCVPTYKVGFHKFWWTEQLDELKLSTIEATSLWRRAGCPRSGPVNDNRLRCKYQYKHAIKEAMSNADKCFNDELYHYFSEKNDSSFWRAWRKKFCSNSVKPVSILNGKRGDADICAEFTSHFRSVYQPNTPNADKQYKDTVDELLSRHSKCDSSDIPRVEIHDVQRCINKLKRNKSPGHDGIMAEHILFGGCMLRVHLSILFNSMLSHAYVPNDFGHGMIIPLLKDKHGDCSKLNMYRGITLSPVMAKLFEHILLDLYEDQLYSDQLQFGFKKQSGCSHALFTFKETARYFTMKGSKVHCAFLDASKAFDKVLHNGLFVKLLKRNISVNFVCLLRNWYEKLTGSVTWNGVTGDLFYVECGVRQGGVLSPILFSIYIDDLITQLRCSGYGAYIGNLYLGSILYADDIALLSGSCRSMQIMLDICTEYSHIWDIQFNPDKSQVMTLGGSNPCVNLFLDRKAIQWCASVKYLGVYFVSGKNLKVDLLTAKRKYYGCFNSIMSVTTKQRNEIVSVNLVTSYCLPKLLYGCESWPVAMVNLSELDVIWNNAYRRIFNSCWRESVRPLQFFCNNLPLSYVIEERRLVFCRKLLAHSNIVLRSLMKLPAVFYEYCGLSYKYSIRNPYCSVATIKRSVWTIFTSTLGL